MVFSKSLEGVVRFGFHTIKKIGPLICFPQRAVSELGEEGKSVTKPAQHSRGGGLLLCQRKAARRKPAISFLTVSLLLVYLVYG